jgi:hypothetical protein
VSAASVPPFGCALLHQLVTLLTQPPPPLLLAPPACVCVCVTLTVADRCEAPAALLLACALGVAQ